MFVNISPAAYNCGESVCSLNFASRCRNVQLGAAKKGTVAEGGEAARLREQVERLQEELASAKNGGGSGASTPSSKAMGATARGAGSAGRSPAGMASTGTPGK